LYLYGWPVTPFPPPACSTIQNCFQRTASASVLPPPALVFSLPKCGAISPTICTADPCRLLVLPLSLSRHVNIMPPTYTNIRIRTARDAEIIFHAVHIGILPMVMQRLGSEERMALCTGCVYVWEERSGSLSESMEQGIERFTEGRSWGPSRYCHTSWSMQRHLLTRLGGIQGSRCELLLPPILRLWETKTRKPLSTRTFFSTMRRTPHPSP